MQKRLRMLFEFIYTEHYETKLYFTWTMYVP